MAFMDHTTHANGITILILLWNTLLTSLQNTDSISSKAEELGGNLCAFMKVVPDDKILQGG